MKSNFCWRALAVVGVLLASALTAFPQDFRATLTGHVSDPNGAAVSGATVTVRNLQTNEEKTATTSEDGNYTVPFLQPGKYSVSVTASGFKKAVSDNVELHTADKATMDVALEIGAIENVVNVDAEAPLLEPDTGSRGQTVENMRINELPLNGRNPIMLAQLAPGVQFNGNPQFTRPFDNGDNANFSVNGGLNRHNEFLLDGAPNNAVTDVNGGRTSSSNNIAFVPTPDATEEFKVQTNAYDAQYGRTGGGIINVTIKPGGRDFHGTVYYFARRYQWDANSFGNNAQGVFGPTSPLAGQERAPRFSRDPVTNANLGGHELDQYGFLVSGPLLIPRFGEGGNWRVNGRERTFFLFNFENYSEASPSPGFSDVPTVLERQGNFSQSGVTIYDPLTSRANPAFNPALPVSATNPQFIRDPFPGNIIPAAGSPGCGVTRSCINPVGQAIVNGFSLPNTTGSDAFGRFNNFINTPALGTDNYHSLIMRIDHQVNDKMHLFFRYVHSRRDQIAFGGNGRVGLGIDAQDPLVRVNNGAVLDSVYTLSANTVLNMRVSFNRFLQAAFRQRSMPFAATTLGFPSSFDAQRPTPIVPRIAFGGDISGIREFGSRNPNSNITNTWSVPVNVTHIAGNHTLRFGGEYRNLQAHQLGGSFVFGGGFFCFTREFTVQDPINNPSPNGQGSAIAALLLGYPSASGCNDNGTTGTSVNNVSPLSFKWGYYATYIQDDWKLSPKLTLNVGLRYDYESPPVEYHNRQNRGFALGQASPIAASVRAAATAAGLTSTDCPACANVTGGLLFSGVGGLPEEAFRKDRNNFQPRFGLAYQLNEKTVLRGGYGLYYFPQAEYGGSLGFNIVTPFSTIVGGGVNALIPTRTLSNPFPTGLQEPVGSSQGLLTQLGGGITFVNPDHGIPQIHEYSFGVQRELPWRMKLDVSYVGSRTRGILSGDQQGGGGRNLNVLSAAQLAAIRANGTFFSASVTNPFAGLIPANATFNAPTITRQRLQQPFPQFGENAVTVVGENVGKLWYESLQASLEKRLSAGLILVASYTFSKTLGALNFLNNQDPAPQKAVVDFDSTHVLVLSGVYQLPFGNGKRFFTNAGRVSNLLFGGWEYTWIANFRSGRPINLPTGANLIADPTLPDSSFAKFFNTCVRQLDGTSRQPNAARTAFEPCTNPAWAIRPANTLADTPFRIANLREPWAPIFDMSVNKMFQIYEDVKVQFRAEAFNAFNTPLFGSPNTGINDLNFGRLIPQNSVRNGNNFRTIQFGVKFYF
ncbi:MAG TPA: TonB-dependent receptor [Pyrinomonadaceae bacterium]|jgi:hypothetical protein